MKCRCPCGITGSLELFLVGAGAAEFIAVIGRCKLLDPRLVIEYVGLWRPGKQGIKLDRAARIADELLTMIDQGFERRGERITEPVRVWTVALQQMIDGRAKLALPLASHGYLQTIVAGARSRAAAEAEQASEDAKRQASAARVSSDAVPVGAVHNTRDAQRDRARDDEDRRRIAAGQQPMHGRELNAFLLQWKP
jgi:hypothetical protein